MLPNRSGYDHIPDPPAINTEEHTNDITYEWNRTARFYEVHRDPNDGNFVTKMKLWLADEAQKLGAPSARTWHIITGKYGLQVLNMAGFLNSKMGPRKEPHVQEVHPVFRFDNWTETTQAEYDVLVPCLKLASAIIEEPQVLGFFRGLMNGEGYEQRYSKVFGDYEVFHPAKSMTRSDCVVMNRLLIDMRKHVKFQLSKGSVKMSETMLLGRTITLGTGGYHPSKGTFDSSISINRDLFDHLNRCAQDMAAHRAYLHQCQVDSKIDADRMTELDELASLFRTQLQTSIILLHELAHAVRAAHAPNHGVLIEPFCSDHRVNEVGYAIEKFILDSHIEAISDYASKLARTEQVRQTCAVPYGFSLTSDWASMYKQGKTGYHYTYALSDPALDYDCWPLPQSYVESFQSKYLWEDEVPAYGFRSLRAPKLEKWKVLAPKVRLDVGLETKSDG